MKVLIGLKEIFSKIKIFYENKNQFNDYRCWSNFEKLLGTEGAYTARRFAKAGYHIAMVARDKNRLSNLENEIPNSKAGNISLQKRCFF